MLAITFGDLPMLDNRAGDLAQVPSGRSKTLTRAPSHGGYREGSGRKPILNGGIKRTFVLTLAHLDLIDTWARQHNIDNRSAALRHLIEQTCP